MKTHQEIDQRSLDLAKEIVKRIDGQPNHEGLDRARAVCARWRKESDASYLREWEAILKKPWTEIRALYTDPGESGQQLRQNSPFCGILTPRERWTWLKQWEIDHESKSA